MLVPFNEKIYLYINEDETVRIFNRIKYYLQSSISDNSCKLFQKICMIGARRQIILKFPLFSNVLFSKLY